MRKPFIPSIPYLFLTSTRRAKASYHLGFLLEAKRDIDGAVRNDPNHADARSMLAELRQYSESDSD